MLLWRRASSPRGVGGRVRCASRADAVAARRLAVNVARRRCATALWFAFLAACCSGTRGAGAGADVPASAAGAWLVAAGARGDSSRCPRRLPFVAAARRRAADVDIRAAARRSRCSGWCWSSSCSAARIRRRAGRSSRCAWRSPACSASTSSSTPTRCCSAGSTPTSGSRAASRTRWCIPFLAVATARNTGWTIEMHMSRGVVFHSTALIVSGVFLLVVAAAGYFVRYFGGDWGRALQIELLFAALLLGLLIASSGRFRSQARVFVSKHFFSLPLRLPRGVAALHAHAVRARRSSRACSERVDQALADLVESPAGALWLRERRRRLPSGRRAGTCRPSTRSSPPTARWRVPRAHAAGSSTSTSARPTRRATPGSSCRPGWRRCPTAWLVVPLRPARELIGFVVLATPRARDRRRLGGARPAEDRRAARRRAISARCSATEALLEARKFDAFNRMSAFVVHDLKNLVAQLSLMLRNAERHRDNPEFQRDMLTTVEHVVERMNQLMLQLRDGTTPVEKPRLVDLDAVVRRVVRAKASRRAAIETRARDRIVRARPRGPARARDRPPGAECARRDGRRRRRVGARSPRGRAARVVEVGDTGIGMTPEFVRERLFKPFETTKPAGMGIGVYESSQYVHELGGRIWSTARRASARACACCCRCPSTRRRRRADRRPAS